jgi:hypothetical protein
MRHSDPARQGFVSQYFGQLAVCGIVALLSLVALVTFVAPELYVPGRGGSLVALPAFAAFVVVSALALAASTVMPLVLYVKHRRFEGIMAAPSPSELEGDWREPPEQGAPHRPARTTASETI